MVVGLGGTVVTGHGCARAESEVRERRELTRGSGVDLTGAAGGEMWRRFCSKRKEVEVGPRAGGAVDGRGMRGR